VFRAFGAARIFHDAIQGDKLGDDDLAHVHALAFVLLCAMWLGRACHIPFVSPAR
jgi:hypothetical protein